MPTLKSLHTYLQTLVERKLWAQVLVALLLGVAIGILIGPSTGFLRPEQTKVVGSWLALPGTLFLKLVQMIMIPLIFASIIGGVAASESKQQLRQMGINVVFYFLATTMIAITIGVLVVTLIKPGLYFDASGFDIAAPNVNPSATPAQALPGWNEIPRHITNLLPDNPLVSMIAGEMLSIVLFTIIIGIALTTLPDQTAEPILRLLSAVQEVCMAIVKWAMKLVPYAVFGLMAQLTASMGVGSLAGIGLFMLTVLCGLALLITVYILIITFLARGNPVSFLTAIRDVQLLAFSTSSSAAVMPLSIKTAEEKLKVHRSISNFLIPVGATVNMDGTALFQGIATIFLAQVFQVDLSSMALLLMIVTIVAASIGTPAIPGGGVIVMAAILQGSGVPPEGLMLIIGVDRLLGMFRTAVNVTGDLTACVVFNRWQKEEAAVSPPVQITT